MFSSRVEACVWKHQAYSTKESKSPILENFWLIFSFIRKKQTQNTNEKNKKKAYTLLTQRIKRLCWLWSIKFNRWQYKSTLEPENKSNLLYTQRFSAVSSLLFCGIFSLIFSSSPLFSSCFWLAECLPWFSGFLFCCSYCLFPPVVLCHVPTSLLFPVLVQLLPCSFCFHVSPTHPSINPTTQSWDLKSLPDWRLVVDIWNRKPCCLEAMPEWDTKKIPVFLS